MRFLNAPRFFGSWVILALGMCYFSYHFVQGRRGVLALFHFQNALDDATQLKEKLFHEKDILENKVVLMRPDSLCLDLLEEETKKNMNRCGTGEHIILDKTPLDQQPQEAD